MFYLVKVLIGRSIVSLDRPFSYYSDEPILAGIRVGVSFGNSKETIGFVLEDSIQINDSVDNYNTKNDIKLSKIKKVIDNEPLLDSNGIKLAKQISNYYHADLIQVLNAMLPPSLKPKDSALNKTQGKFVEFVFADEYSIELSKNEKKIYYKIKENVDGIRATKITAKKTLNSLLEKKAVHKEMIPVSRIPALETKTLIPFDLTNSQKQAFEEIYNGKEKIYLLQGVTGSGKTEVYIRLAEEYLKQNKTALILVPEITLNDHMSYIFASHFKDTLSILNSSLSDSRKYDEYKRILSGETKVVLGTRSAVFAPIKDLGIIIIDEEHSSSYKQDNSPYYDAIKVSIMRCENEGCKLILASATPRIIDKARATHNIYKPVYMNQRISKEQDKDIIFVDMNDSSNLNPNISSLISIPLQKEISKTLNKKEQVMILLNRRGYSPIYVCRNCHHIAKCPNCSIPLNYHKKDDSLRCHHCGYKIYTVEYECECKGKDFLTLGYGTQRAYEELKMLFPTKRILRLDSDISSNNVRHEILTSFKDGDADILIGTQVIAKGLDFPRLTLAAILDCDSSLRLPTYLANEETFDLISQFVGRAGRKDLRGKIVLQTYVPDNNVLKLASIQDYNSFYKFEMEERRKYQYPPYTFLTKIEIKTIDSKLVDDVALKVKNYILSEIGNKKINIYGPSAPYIPHINGRYYRHILLKYKSIQEVEEILNGIKTLRIANKNAEISVNVDPNSNDI